MSRFLNFLSLIKWPLVILIILLAGAALIGSPVPVQGVSMEPNFHSGEVVVVDRLSYSGGKAIPRGEVVAARFPVDPSHTKLIKRIVGLPGETISSSNGFIYINGQKLDESAYSPRQEAPPYQEMGSTTLNSGQYFLAGDNRAGSSDSRLWGPVTRQDIIGRVSFSIWPLSTARFIN